MDVTLSDWLELLQIDPAITGLIVGTVTLTEARTAATTARDTWPSVSQDYVTVLDQLEPFLAAVAAAIEEQREIVAQFNQVAGEFGFGIEPPVDRLLTQTDVDEMRATSELLAAHFEELRLHMQLLEAELEDLMLQLDEALDRIEQGAESAEQEISDLADEAEGLVDQMQSEGCLPS